MYLNDQTYLLKLSNLNKQFKLVFQSHIGNSFKLFKLKVKLKNLFYFDFLFYVYNFFWF